jgi:2-polyprenyl-6-methoxyphenol hydroxylase-like FAD-dependent oxidoreductase
MADYDVAICGAGVAGLTLANMLGRQGLRILVIDKQARPRDMHKGEVLQPRSLEIFRDLGLLTPLHEAGPLMMERLVSADAEGRELECLDYRMLPGDFQHCLVHYHKNLTEVLASQAPPSVEFCRGVTADGLLSDSGGRTLGVRLRQADQRQDVTAILTVAADGHASRLRREAGISAVTRQYDHQLVSLDVGGMPDLGTDILMYLHGQGGRVIFQMPGDRARLYATIPVGGFRDVGRAGLREWIAWMAGSLPALAPLSEVLQRNVSGVQVLSAWRFIAAAWARPGLVLIGDAAHCVHPMVGQGMNAAIADAWALGAHLAAAGPLTQETADDALRLYEQARRPQVEYVAKLSHSLASFFAGTSLAGRTVLPHILRRRKPNLRIRYKLTYNVAGYGWQPLSLWDWTCVSGLVPDPHRGGIPVHVRGDPRPVAHRQPAPAALRRAERALGPDLSPEGSHFPGRI